MNRPKIVMHNSVSLDGAFIGFEVDIGQHYSIARAYWINMILTGSRTVVTGIEIYEKAPPSEEESDLVKPEKGSGIPYWVVPDTGGVTQGLLHIIRRSEFCRDVILLVSEKTSRKFIDYLEERHYDYLVCGQDKVDLATALNWLSEKYAVDILMVDAGPTLNRVLLKHGLVDEISLLVHPVVVGSSSDKLLNHLTNVIAGIKLELLESTDSDNGTVLLRYRVIRESYL